jgi:hypothetical protein
MALLSSGAISANAINLEIGVSGTAALSLNSNNVRMLSGQASGSTSAISFNSFYSKTYADGSTSAKAASSAQYIKNLTGTTTNGAYWIDLPTVGPTQTYCIMDPAYSGGGWMMMMKATTGTTFNYDANYWTTANTLNPTETNQNNGDAKYNIMNYFSATDMMARWPDIGSGGSIGGLGSWIWLENSFNGGTGITPISFFTNAGTYAGSSPTGPYGGKFIRDAKTFSGWGSGTFSSQADVRFYGFNFINYYSQVYFIRARVRWGFGWNENSEGLYSSAATLATGGAPGSDDVSGGIGMDSGFGNFSAGDKINCCQDSTGINRSARVEVYVR